MQLLVNDLSVHGQFPNLDKFRDAMARIMAIREVATRYERELHRHSSFSITSVTSEMSLIQAVHKVPDKDWKRAVMQWLDRGPFWDVEQRHEGDDYFECKGKVVTDTVIGEAAYRCMNESETNLVSLIPSDWNFSPIPVQWCKDDDNTESVEIDNYMEAKVLEEALRAALPPISSWEMLADRSNTHFPRLTFLPDSFAPLRGHPFSKPASGAIFGRLQVLDRLRMCFDEEGRRTVEGDRLDKDYFHGERAWFSDSTPKEKNDFRTEMTFPHPDITGKDMFCPWHGKVNYPNFPIRIHFSWPVPATEPLYVAYVEPKITRY